MSGMEPESPSASERERRLDEIVAEYLDAARAGRRPSRQDFLERHAAFKTEIEDFLESLDRLGELPGLGGSAGAGRTPPSGPPASGGGPWTLGDYEVLEEVGRGGMGVVYKARQRSLNRVVALKVLLTGAFASEDERRRFVREAEAAASLDHPQIVPIYEIGRDAGQSYFSMRWVDGGTLGQRSAGLAGDPRRVAELAALLADAVHYAHEHGVLHRDLKPSNVLLDRNGHPLIADFGLARLADGSSLLTRSGAVIGTPSYMAPEQAQGRPGAASAAADVYGLGAILYEVLTGRPPFKEESSVETIRRVIDDEPARPRSIEPGVPRDLESICLKCLEKRPAARYESAAALARDLRRFLAGEPVEARAVSELHRAWRWCRRHRAVTAVWALLASIAVGATAAALLLHRAGRESENRLRESYVAQAQAMSRSDEPDRRQKGLAAVAKAAAIRPSAELRDEAAACLALVGLETIREWSMGEESTAGALDSRFERFASGDARGNVAIYRLPAAGAGIGEPLETLPATGGETGRGVSFLRFSPDGRHFAAIHGTLAESVARVWELESRRTLFSMPTRMTGNCRPLEFHPAAARMVCVAADHSIAIHDLGSERPGEPLQTIPPRASLPISVRFSPDGARLAVSFQSPRVEIHDLASGRVDAITAPQFVYHVAWHPAAPSLAIAAQDSVVHFYDLATGEVRASMDRAETSVFSTAAFNARGSLLATTGWDQLLRVWNPISGRAEVVDQKRGSALEVQFRADDRQLASVAEGREYTVWNVAESDGCRSFARADWFDLSPDGRLVACVQGDVAKLLDAGSGRELASYKDLRVEWVQFSPDGRLLATKAQLPSGGAGLFLSPLVWRQSGAMETLRVGPPRFVLGSRRSWFGKFAFSADGGSLAMTLGANGVGPYAAVIDTAPPESIRTLVEHPGVNHLALDPSGSVLTTAAFHGRDVKAWELPSGALLKTLPLAKGLVESSPDGESLLVSSGKDFTLFRVQTWEKLWSVARDDPSDVATPGTFSASGSIVALGKSKRVATLHDAASGRKLVALRSPNPGFIADRLKFSADGAKLWVGRADGSLEVWDLRSLRSRLAALGLDWEGAPFPAPGADREKLEIQVEVDLGDLGPNSWPTIGDRQLDSALRRFRERAQAR